MKKKNKTICKWNGCQKEFDRNEVAQQYGRDSNVFLLGYCCAYCYTKDRAKKLLHSKQKKMGVLIIIQENVISLAQKRSIETQDIAMWTSEKSVIFGM